MDDPFLSLKSGDDELSFSENYIFVSNLPILYGVSDKQRNHLRVNLFVMYSHEI